MILTNCCISIALLALSWSLPLPPGHLRTWDPDEGQREAYNQWLETHKRHIVNRNWKAVNPKDYIAHDKFNIADGYDIDLLIVEEMQLAGDPVVAIENKANEERDKGRKKNVSRKRPKHRVRDSA